MWRMILGSVMMLFVIVGAITYEQQSGDTRTYASMVGGAFAIIGLPGALLFFAGWRAQNHKE